MPHDTAVPPSQQMFQIVTGFWASQAVGVMAELAIADHLEAGAATATEELARVTGTDAGALFRLLRACATLGVLKQDRDGRFSLTPLGQTLRSNVPGSMRDMAMAQAAPGHWLPWGRLGDAVRTGVRQTPAALGHEIFEHYAQNAAEGAAFMGAMNNLSALVSSEVARLVDATAAARAVDVGGAQGTLIAALLRANPKLAGVLLELPHVVPGAKAAIAALALADRCEVVAGDFFKAVPAAADLYVLKQVLHDWDDGQCQAILGNCARAMSPKGRVVIVEMVIPDDGSPTAAQLMDLNMLVMLPGRERTAGEYGTLLAAAGLRIDRVLQTHSPFQIIEAVRAA
jgi:hypothetical protein